MSKLTYKNCSDPMYRPNPIERYKYILLEIHRFDIGFIKQRSILHYNVSLDKINKVSNEIKAEECYGKH